MYDIVYLPIARNDMMLAVLQSMSGQRDPMEAGMNLLNHFDYAISSLRDLLFVRKASCNYTEDYRRLAVEDYTVYYEVQVQNRRIEIRRVLNNKLLVENSQKT